jgi:cell division protein FtsQ
MGTMTLKHASSGAISKIRTSNKYRGPSSASMGRLVCFVGGLTCKALLFLVLVTGISIGLLYSYRWLTSSTLFSLENVEITGTHHLNQKQVLTLGGLTRGQNLLNQNISDIRRNLMANPWVAEATVKRVLPDTIRIAIREQSPAFWVRWSETLAYADAQGKIIDKIQAGAFYSLPLLEQEAGSDGSVVNKLLVSFQARKLPFTLHEVAMVENLRTRMVRISLKEQGPEIILDANQADASCSSLCAVWKDLNARGEMKHISNIFALGSKVWVQFKEKEV